MTLVPRREYVLLLAGDALIFALSLYLTLALRYLQIPSMLLLERHIVPFSVLFVVWIIIFFLAGLYGKHTRLFRSRLPASLLSAQIVNVIIAALFFFLIPFFGLAPKTILLIYLIVSSLGIYLWRVVLFPRIPRIRKLKGVMIAAGPDAETLVKEVEADGRYPFTFAKVIDTSRTQSHEIIQHALRMASEDDMTFLVVDFRDKAFAAARPIVYDAAFRKRRFVIVDIVELYQEVFERVPLSLVQYEWILSSVSASRLYDTVKRAIDILGAFVVGAVSLIFYPIAALAIKLDDGGPLFIVQYRVGKYERPISVLKFRSMSGNDQGDYGQSGKTKLQVTRAGAWLRLLRIDEFPQLLNVLRGDLSLVGPRPELPALAREYSARIPYYNARYLVAPGLTGWAQIKHDRDPHHGTDIEETKVKLSYDLYYLRHRSLLLDIFIILQTIRIVVTARGS